MSSSASSIDNEESTFAYFSRVLLKSFMTLVIVFMFMSVKQQLIDKESTIFLMALFVVIGTLLLTILGMVDQYVYSNISLGIGIALGLNLLKTEL